MKANRAGISDNEQGFAAIVISMVMVLVLSLITVGFAELMRQEERSALDKQLSSQAYYAAESGINDAAKALNAGFSERKTSCEPFTPSQIATATSSIPDPALRSIAANAAQKYLSNSTLRGSTDFQYTCLTVDPAPLTNEFDEVGTDQSTVVKVTGVDPADGKTVTPIGTLEISWQDSGNAAPPVPDGTPQFDRGENWPYIGVLRVSLTSLASGEIRRDSLINNTYNSFLYPNASDAAVESDSGAATGNSSGTIAKGNCDADRRPLRCSVKITNLTQANYLLSLRSVYKSSRVSVSAYAFDGRQLAIRNSQTVVDATGKAQDVLRRVQVRIPTTENFNTPPFGIQSMNGICKQFSLIPPTVGPSQTTAACPYP